MIEVGRDDVQRLLTQPGMQLVDVLPAKEYGEEHLPGAMSIPLKELGDGAGKDLDPDRPVIVYCFDTQCDLSPRAAWRLESLGFAAVYDYVAGRADWSAAGLPIEGSKSTEARVGAVAHRDVPRCRRDDPVAQVKAGLAGFELAVVLDEREVVLGVVPSETLELDGRRTAESVMHEGPVTFRPDVPVTELAEWLAKHKLPRALVTTGGGVLIGLVRRDELLALAAAPRKTP